jgi:hypothetical protein
VYGERLKQERKSTAAPSKKGKKGPGKSMPPVVPKAPKPKIEAAMKITVICVEDAQVVTELRYRQPSLVK